MTKAVKEAEAFKGFRFARGQRVVHRASGAVGVICARILIESQTGNTGHMYEVSTGEKYNKRLDIELEAEGS